MLLINQQQNYIHCMMESLLDLLKIQIIIIYNIYCYGLIKMIINIILYYTIFKKSILINNLFNDDIYSIFIQEPEEYHYGGGCIINKENNEYLVSSSFNGYINIWDLYNNYKCHLSSVIQWNSK